MWWGLGEWDWNGVMLAKCHFQSDSRRERIMRPAIWHREEQLVVHNSKRWHIRIILHWIYYARQQHAYDKEICTYLSIHTSKDLSSTWFLYDNLTTEQHPARWNISHIYCGSLPMSCPPLIPIRGSSCVGQRHRWGNQIQPFAPSSHLALLETQSCYCKMNWT